MSAILLAEMGHSFSDESLSLLASPVPKLVSFPPTSHLFFDSSFFK